ncbi:hypothetical protein P43SY_006637 [Pythium insidiosum]|uniref:Uncharacterized protein n=1 Tax=Pythium insidiosum TaxID=114742 RepID=A0AAD5Q9F6_PYTIN|nr:hypothetical protein P43SY_006637 [Pythium insidiosum]
MPTSRLYAGAVALLALTIVYFSCNAESVAAQAHDHDHAHGHDHAGNSTAIDPDHGSLPDNATASASASPWAHIALWNLTAAESRGALSLCAEPRAAKQIMVVALLPVGAQAVVSSERDIAPLVAHADDMIESSNVTRRDITSSSTVALDVSAPLSTLPLYRVQLDERSCVNASLNVSGAMRVALFAQYSPANGSAGVLSSSQRSASLETCLRGCPAADASESTRTTTTSTAARAASTNWAGPILASIVLALTSLLGVLLLSLGKRHIDVVVDYMMSFAAGCLLAVTVFHLYPEGASYVSDLDEWVSGACVLSGVAFSMGFEQSLHLLLASFGQAHAHHGHGHGLGHSHGHPGGRDSHKNHDAPVLESSRGSRVLRQILTAQTPVRPSQAPEIAILESQARSGAPRDSAPLTFRQKYVTSLRFVEPIAWVTAMGDFFHAFTDGVVLAVAFKSCSSALGWAVALGVVMHEVPHRVGDFFIFIRAGMLVAQALMVNFIASLASLLAVLVVLAAGSVSDTVLGIMLLVGAGALFFIAMTKLLPPMLEAREPRQACLHFLWFAVGCVVIGLSMLQHAHCEVDASADGGHGHEH